MDLELDESANDSAQAEADQDTLGDAILGASKSGKSSEGTEDKGGGESPPEKKEAEEKAEAKSEETKTDTKAPESAEDREIAKILEQHKGDPKAVAKALLGMKGLVDRQGPELGQLRKAALEFEQEKQRIEQDPEGYAKQLLAKVEKDKGTLFDKALDDPTVLEDFIKTEINRGISDFQAKQKEEQLLRQTYGEDYDTKKVQVEQLEQLVALGKIPMKEVLLWAVDGYSIKDKLEAAKKIVREEDKEAMAAKHAETVDKQRVVSSDKEGELDLEDEEVKQNVLGDAILGAKRGR